MLNYQNYHKSLKGTFGVVKLWPGISVAEDECIARIKEAANYLGLGCIVVDYEGKPMDAKDHGILPMDLDFILSLHFEHPKLYPSYSYYPLWNPVQFYHDWGYERHAANIGTHDGFLSSDGDGALRMIRRILHGQNRDPLETVPFYPSTSSHVCLEPDLKNARLFYCGVNWEAANPKKTSRYQGLLKKLDDPDLLEIYGPEELHGFRVWDGYSSYRGSLDFDGISLLHAANKAGIVLALSSPAHKTSGIVSNRLWEGLAAGAFIICDQPVFGKRHFGNTLAYVNSDADADDLNTQIRAHVDWVRKNSQAALEMAQDAQNTYKNAYCLDKTLPLIYEHQAKYRKARTSISAGHVNIICPIFELDPEKLIVSLDSIQQQTVKNISVKLVYNDAIGQDSKKQLTEIIKNYSFGISTVEKPFYDKANKFQGLGSILEDTLRSLEKGDESYVQLIGVGEVLLIDHLAYGIMELSRNPQAQASYSNAILRNEMGSGSVYSELSLRDPTLRDPKIGGPLGVSRFIFRCSALAPYMDILIPDLLGNPLLPIILFEKVVKTGQSSILLSDLPSKEIKVQNELSQDIESLRLGHPLKARSIQREGEHNSERNFFLDLSILKEFSQGKPFIYSEFWISVDDISQDKISQDKRYKSALMRWYKKSNFRKKLKSMVARKEFKRQGVLRSIVLTPRAISRFIRYGNYR